MLQIFNSLTRRKEPFQPIDPGKVRMYVCGMTVYDHCHVGHARVMVVFDIVLRWLRAKGYALVEFKEAAPATAPGLSLHYVLDAVASPNLYRVTVMVGQKSLSRAYLAQNNRVAPAGAWVRKE